MDTDNIKMPVSALNIMIR